jgi:hypothetical protein
LNGPPVNNNPDPDPNANPDPDPDTNPDPDPDPRGVLSPEGATKLLPGRGVFSPEAEAELVSVRNEAREYGAWVF